MNKKIIAGMGTATILGLGSLVQINPAPLTPNEWQALVQVYDYELKTAKANGTEIVIPNVTDGNMYKQINDQIRKRTPTETNLIIDETPVTPVEYTKFRENMLNKVEKRTVLQAIIE